MPERKISDDNNYWGKDYFHCRSPEHLPATMVVRTPGTYEHTCPNCGFKTIFEVPPAPSMTVEQQHALNIRPVGEDGDGNGVWQDDTGERWNSGEPLTKDEQREVYG